MEAGTAKNLNKVFNGLAKKPLSKTKETAHNLEQISKLVFFPTEEDLAGLQSLCWTGVPRSLRSFVWPILFGYVPLSATVRTAAELDLARNTHLAKQRAVYAELKTHFAATRSAVASAVGAKFLKQIGLDVPRTWVLNRENFLPATKRVLQQSLAGVLETVLASLPQIGYVQGINEVAGLMLLVFADPLLAKKDTPVTAEAASLEADTYWCLVALLRRLEPLFLLQKDCDRSPLDFVDRLATVLQQMDSEFADSLKTKGVEFVHFALRWLNCFYVRELPRLCVERLWDTFLAESAGGDFFKGFLDFAIYFSAVVLITFREELIEKNFQDVVLFLQQLPTENWGDHEIETLISKAYLYKSIFEGTIKYK